MKELILGIPELIAETVNNALGDALFFILQYEMLSHLSSCSSTAIIEKPDSGKTSLLIPFLSEQKMKNIFSKGLNHIHLAMSKSSREYMKNL